MMIFCVNSYTQESRFRVKTTLPKTNIALGLPSPKRNPNPFPLPRFFRCKTMWFLASVSVTILVEFWRRFIPQNSPSLRRDSSKTPGCDFFSICWTLVTWSEAAFQDGLACHGCELWDAPERRQRWSDLKKTEWRGGVQGGKGWYNQSGVTDVYEVYDFMIFYVMSVFFVCICLGGVNHWCFGETHFL